MTDKSSAWVPVKAPVTIPVYCDSCVHFKSRAIRVHDGKPATCSQVGILAKARTCKDFIADPFSRELVDMAQDKALSQLVARVKPTGLAALAALLVGELDTRHAGFRYGQTVYVNIVAVGRNEPGNDRDYVANYYRGNMICVRDGVAYVTYKSRMRLAVNVNAILSLQEWQQRRAYLLEQRRYVDKRNPYSWTRTDVKLIRDPATRPPWLDDAIIKYAASNTVQEELYTPEKPKRGRKKRDRSND